MKVLVILSGGIDSSTCLYHHLRQYDNGKYHEVMTVTFDYGQRHRREIESAKKVAAVAKVYNAVIPLPIHEWTDSALLGDSEIPHGHYTDESMKQTVVPYRNLMMIAVAAGIASKNDCDGISYGAHSGDALIYPDCTPAFATAMKHTLYTGDYARLQLFTPLIGMNKKQVVAYARDIGVPLALTWSCYEGGDEPCGKCGACVAREEALA
jgi:7-cyano-7-deazaguanine synthase